ncbi:MAG: hypothetical protein ACFFG0_18670 [Candidatus Thorarchaeota archaeon]
MNVGMDNFRKNYKNFILKHPDFSRLLKENGTFTINYFSSDSKRSFKEFINFIVENQNLDIIRKYIINLIYNCSIWLSPEFYQNIPIFLPFSVRERTSWQYRQKNLNGDNWGSANNNGYIIDDNSDIKDFIRNAIIVNNKFSNDQKPRTGFIACHIWSNTTSNPRLYSFVPNIVWLPRPIAKLSDDQTSFLSQILKIISLKIYREIDIDNYTLKQIIKESWSLLLRNPDSPNYNDNKIKNIIQTSNILYSNQNIERRKSTLIRNIEKILSYIKLFINEPNYKINPGEKLIHSRYLSSLLLLINKDNESVREYSEWLNLYLNTLK